MHSKSVLRKPVIPIWCSRFTHLPKQILYTLTSNYPSISASILRCMVLSFQPSGAIKMYFTIDIHANSTLTTSTMKQAVMNEIRHEQGDYNLHHYEGGGVASIDPLFLDFDDLTCSDPSPCLNGATCRLDDNFGILCFCEGGFTGQKCEFAVPLTTEMAMTDVEGHGLGTKLVLSFDGFVLKEYMRSVFQYGLVKCLAGEKENCGRLVL